MPDPYEPVDPTPYDPDRNTVPVYPPRIRIHLPPGPVFWARILEPVVEGWTTTRRRGSVLWERHAVTDAGRRLLLVQIRWVNGVVTLHTITSDTGAPYRIYPGLVDIPVGLLREVTTPEEPTLRPDGLWLPSRCLPRLVERLDGEVGRILGYAPTVPGAPPTGPVPSLTVHPGIPLPPPPVGPEPWPEEPPEAEEPPEPTDPLIRP